MNEHIWKLSREVEITKKNQIGRLNKKNTFEFTCTLETVEEGRPWGLAVKCAGSTAGDPGFGSWARAHALLLWPY